MQQSPEIDKLAEALSRFQKSVGGAKKASTAKIPTKSGGEYSYKYSTLEEVWDTVKENDLLAECGLALTQTNGFVIVGEDIHDTLETAVLHVSGQWKSGEMILRLKSLDSQGQGSAMTYARRYAMCAILGIVQSDDDGAAATEQQRTTRQPAASDTPDCPNCKLTLRRDKQNPKKLYCWKAKGGCGYDSTQDEPEDGEDTPKPASSNAASSKETATKPAATTEDRESPKAASAASPTANANVEELKDVLTASPSEESWAELKEMATANKWPIELVKLQIEQRQRKGIKPTQIFNEMREKCKLKNTSAVDS